MIKVNLDGLKQKDAARQVLPEIGLVEDRGGIVVTASAGEQNSCKLSGGKYRITYASDVYVFRALKNLAENEGKDFEITENCALKEMGVMPDCSRNSVLSIAGAKKLIRILAVTGYNMLLLYTEDTYEIKDEPYFGYLRGRYSGAEIKELDAYARSFGIELVPCIQTLAHLNAIFRWPQYGAICDCNDILLAKDERTFALIENMFKSLAENFTSRSVNIGMDEAHMLGLGKYLDKHGFENRFDIMLDHLSKVGEIAKKYGFSAWMWSDMFFRLAFSGNYYESDGEIPAEVFEKIPTDIRLLYWDYYSNDEKKYDAMIKMHKKFPNEIGFAGGFWTWVGFAPHNEFSLSNTEKALKACKKNGVDRAFFTMWGDNGGECSAFGVLPSIVHTAESVYGVKKMSQIKKSFLTVTGMKWDDFMCLGLVDSGDADPYKEIVNPAKYMLYSDLFLGFIDSTIDEGQHNARFAASAKRLSRCTKNERWGYIFKSHKALCEVLFYKSDLGVRLRALYKKGDKAAIERLLTSDFKPMQRKLDEFYNAFLAYWNTDFKPHGFDVQDIRLGGLNQRIKHQVAVLKDYVAGKIAVIPELEEKILDLDPGDPGSKKLRAINGYTYASSINFVG